MKRSVINWSPSPVSLLLVQTIYFMFSLWAHWGKESKARSCVHQSVFILLNFICNFNPQVRSPTKFFCSSAQFSIITIPRPLVLPSKSVTSLYNLAKSEKFPRSVAVSCQAHLHSNAEKGEKLQRYQSYRGEQWNSHRFESFVHAFTGV